MPVKLQLSYVIPKTSVYKMISNFNFCCFYAYVNKLTGLKMTCIFYIMAMYFQYRCKKKAKQKTIKMLLVYGLSPNLAHISFQKNGDFPIKNHCPKTWKHSCCIKITNFPFVYKLQQPNKPKIIKKPTIIKQSIFNHCLLLE